ncbi:MAG: hypothetical protein NTV61_03985 [Candidatus Bathyarchaeota archaeon]|nr:hypothetical protein [Candidatus Bathyarchaeota archaeon]
MVSVIHLRQLEAAKRLGKRRHWSDEDEKAEKEGSELTEEERLQRVRVYDAGDIL